MQITDTIADMLTRIRNAQAAKHDTVDVPASNMKKAICQILVDEGYVKSFSVTEDGKQGIITHHPEIWSGQDRRSSQGLQRVSKPGLRIYTSCEDMPKVMKGLGIAIISTSKGDHDRPCRPARRTSAAKSWRSFGKEGVREYVAELEESPSIFPPALK